VLCACRGNLWAWGYNETASALAGRAQEALRKKVGTLTSVHPQLVHCTALHCTAPAGALMWGNGSWGPVVLTITLAFPGRGRGSVGQCCDAAQHERGHWVGTRIQVA